MSKANVPRQSSKEDQNSVFEVLIQEIMSTSDYVQREAFIRKHSSKIVPLVKWLAKTVVLLDSSGDVVSKSRAQDADTQESSLTDKENVALFSLNCLLFISSAATSDNICQDLCDVIMEQSNFLWHLNYRIFTGRANDSHLGILVNYSRHVPIVDYLVQSIFPRLKNFIPKLIKYLKDPIIELEGVEYNRKQLLSAYLTNLSQSETIRNDLIEQKLLFSLFDVYENASNDIELRKSVISLVRNCCFDTAVHQSLITEQDSELIVKLVYPLAGPEELPREEMEKLPIDLQYLPLDKCRETNADIRKLFLETIHLLCSTRYGRVIVRDLDIYYHLREYHKWETDSEALISAENLIDILIKTEEEIKVDNLKDLEIPEELVSKFEKFNCDIRKNE